MLSENLSASIDDAATAIALATKILSRLGYTAKESRVDADNARVEFGQKSSIWVGSSDALDETLFVGAARFPPSLVVITYRARPTGGADDSPVLGVSVTAYAQDPLERRLSHTRSDTELQRIVRALRSIPELA